LRPPNGTFPTSAPILKGHMSLLEKCQWLGAKVRLVCWKSAPHFVGKVHLILLEKCTSFCWKSAAAQ
jgi:hypothetical protein